MPLLAQLSQVIVLAQLGHLIGSLSLSRYTSTGGMNCFINRSMSDSGWVGGNMPHSLGCHWTFFLLTYYVTYQTSDKQVSKRQQVSCGTTLQRCVFPTYSRFYLCHKWEVLTVFLFLASFVSWIYAVWLPDQRPPRGLWIMCRKSRPPWGRLRRIHTRVNQFRTAFSRYASLTSRNFT